MCLESNGTGTVFRMGTKTRECVVCVNTCVCVPVHVCVCLVF